MAEHSISHYQVLEKLGEGGMGVVYKARDLKLERLVALKFLAPDLLPSRAAQTRFLHEARATSRLNHPHIATIYAVEEDGDQVCLVLEYLSGGTLRELLRTVTSSGRRLPPQQVLTYASQIADALAHAHRHGIWHRDIKTSNAMLSSEGAIKLTDFGLAKLAEGSEMTAPGVRMGTAAYMSPEQFLGAETDHRSDIFSFGVVLYEMAAGQPPLDPMHGGTLARQFATGSRPAVQFDRPDLPADYDRIMKRALEKEPQDRYQSMDDLAGDLHAILPAAPASAATAGGVASASTVTIRPPVRLGRVRRVLMWAAGAVVLAAASFFLLRGRGAENAVSPGARVLLADVENRTGDEQLNAATDLLRSQLSQSVRFDIVDNTAVPDVLARMVKPPNEPLRGDIAREVAWRAGVPLIVSGTVSQLGQAYVFNLRIEKIGDNPKPARTWFQAFDARDKRGLLAATRTGSNWVRQITGESATEVAQADRPVEETTTDSWQALQSFSRAESVRREGRTEEAIALLEEAVKVDPHFALACTRLGDILTSLQRQDEGLAWYRRALEEMRIRTLSKREALRIRGLYALDTGDYPSAESAFRVYADSYRNDPMPLVMRALTLEQEGRTDEALEQLRQAEQRDSRRYELQVYMANACMVKGRFDEAARHEEVLRRMGQADWADFVAAGAAFLQGRYEEALGRYAALSASHNSYLHNRAFLLRAGVYSELGRYGEAASVLREGIQYDIAERRASDQADKLLALADLALRREDRVGARQACLGAVQLDRSPQRLSRAGTILARAGYPAVAERLAAMIQGNENIFQAARWRIAGEVLLARGAPAEAIVNFRHADAVEPAGRPRQYLARALVLSGDAEGALRLYRRVLETRNLSWQSSEPQPLGLWADALLQQAVLASSLGHVEEARTAASEYEKIRSGEDQPARDLDSARKIARRSSRN